MNVEFPRSARLTHRRAFIGGSDARVIMGNDEVALVRLWREKRGEVEPEDLSGNLVVQLGIVTEATVRILRAAEGATPVLFGFPSSEAAGSAVAGIGISPTPSGASASMIAFITVGVAATVPPSPTPFTPIGFDLLGTGLKSQYLQKCTHGPGLTGVVNYAWRVEEMETDVRVFTACGDLGRLQAAMPDIDQLTNTISVEPL